MLDSFRYAGYLLENGNEIHDKRFRGILDVKQSEEEKRRILVEQSSILFFRYGMSKLTMEDFASRQGISKKTLYKYFPNKYALVDEIIRHQMVTIAGKIAAARADESLEFPAKFSSVLGVIVEQVGKLGEQLVRDMYYTSPEHWAKIEKFRSDYVFKAIGELLVDGMKTGYVRDDINPQIVIPLLLNTIQSMMTPEQMIKIPFPVVEVFSTFVRVIFGGILTDSARKDIFRNLGLSESPKEKS